MHVHMYVNMGRIYVCGTFSLRDERNKSLWVWAEQITVEGGGMSGTSLFGCGQNIQLLRMEAGV